MDSNLYVKIKTLQDFPVELETWPRKSTPKKICLHHTASGPGSINDVEWWKRDGQPVSTPLIVDRDGTAYQIYSSKRWAFHLGVRTANFRELEAATIGLEIDSWGGLVLRDGKFYAWPNKFGNVVVPNDEVCILDKPHRGVRYFHKYTAEQIETVRLLLLFWKEQYGITLDYVGDKNMFELSTDAVDIRKSGVYSHNSFRADKNDIHPQPDMVEMFKSLR